MDESFLASARSGADYRSANGKPVLCLLPRSTNAQRGEGRSFRFAFMR